MNGAIDIKQSVVFKLILANVIIFALQMFFGRYQVPYDIMINGQSFQTGMPVVEYYFGLIPVSVVEKFFIWQPLSYMFLHANFMHIFLNMYALLIFGVSIEHVWGSKRFLQYYFFTGIGAGVTILVINIIMGGQSYFIPTIGASGAVFGLLLAFGVLFPDVEILLFFVLPIKAKYLVILYGGIEFFSLVSYGQASTISHAGHLGGLLFGLIYFGLARRRGLQFKSRILKAKIQKEIKKKDAHVVEKNDDSRHQMVRIVKKVRDQGFSSLSDDEIQRVRYLQIMTEGEGNLCNERDFNIDDDYCLKCEHFNDCILRELNKYIK